MAINLSFRAGVAKVGQMLSTEQPLAERTKGSQKIKPLARGVRAHSSNRHQIQAVGVYRSSARHCTQTS